MKNQSVLILIRGLPGAGKTTLANTLSENSKYPVFSIDTFFTKPNGEYEFNFEDNHKAYKACETNTENALKKNTSKVFVDNTFTLDWEIEPYFKLAKTYNYQVHVITVENYHNSTNVHGVSVEQLKKMAEKYKVKLMP